MTPVKLRQIPQTFIFAWFHKNIDEHADKSQNLWLTMWIACG